MLLINPNPVVTPTIESKIFPHLWIYSLSIHAPSPTTGKIIIETLPYDSNTKEMANGSNVIVIETDKFWESVSEVPEVSSAMAAVFSSITPLREWIETNKQKMIDQSIEHNE
jgi:hypothetical protein